MRRFALVVDDEYQVRSLITRVLKSIDFDIIEAESEKEAWDQYLQHKDEINFVITEVDMLYGDGLRLYKQIREQSKTAVVVVSGDCLEFPFQQAFDDPYAAVLIKPYSLETLIQTTHLIDDPIDAACSV